MPPGALPWVVSLAALIGLLARWRSLDGTTLRAPWYWMLAATSALTAVEGVARFSGGAAQPHLRYLAAIATFCPLIAVLGAKRPQDRAWQFIVASLWMVAALPAVQQAIARPGASLELHGAWQWFLLILILLGLFNGIATRYWPGSLLVLAGQVLMLVDHLPLGGARGFLTVESGALWHWGATLWTVAAGLWGWDLPRRRPPMRAWDRLWLDFRDLVGTIWSVRVAERINAAAAQHRWPARLSWHGWTLEGPPPPELDRSMRMLLRRFVSPAWIDQRLGSEDDRPIA